MPLVAASPTDLSAGSVPPEPQRPLGARPLQADGASLESTLGDAARWRRGVPSDLPGHPPTWKFPPVPLQYDRVRFPRARDRWWICTGPAEAPGRSNRPPDETGRPGWPSQPGTPPWHADETPAKTLGPRYSSLATRCFRPPFPPCAAATTLAAVTTRPFADPQPWPI